MRRILLTLPEDTTATECVSCDHRYSRRPTEAGEWTDRCNAFDVVLDKVSRRNFVKRAPECLAAEAAAARMVEIAPEDETALRVGNAVLAALPDTSARTILAYRWRIAEAVRDAIAVKAEVKP